MVQVFQYYQHKESGCFRYLRPLMICFGFKSLMIVVKKNHILFKIESSTAQTSENDTSILLNVKLLFLNDTNAESCDNQYRRMLCCLQLCHHPYVLSFFERSQIMHSKKYCDNWALTDNTYLWSVMTTLHSLHIYLNLLSFLQLHFLAKHIFWLDV